MKGVSVSLSSVFWNGQHCAAPARQGWEILHSRKDFQRRQGLKNRARCARSPPLLQKITSTPPVTSPPILHVTLLIKGVSRIFQGFSRIFQMSMQGQFKVLSRFFKVLSRLFKGSFKALSLLFQGSFKVLSRIFQGSFKVLSNIFLVFFKGVLNLIRLII